MPAKDRYHSAVMRALEKAGWTIEGENYTLVLRNRHLWVDIRASKPSEKRMILVEVKGFEPSGSIIEYWMQVIGQYMVYKAIIQKAKIADVLCLEFRWLLMKAS
ncbi:MAG: element excision factor XisH family protein [Chloroflexota bacterium]|nr:element excision factor XisH family protein [Chloroflexota bacterium]